MGWSSPRTFTAGEIITASILNAHLRDQLLYLKGVGQVPTIQSGLTIDNSLGSERLLLPLLSTAECSTVLNAEGEVAFDETLHKIKYYDDAGIETILNVSDVDDTPANGATTDPISSNWAYDFINILTTQADLPYATAAGTWARLAKGTGLQQIRMNSGATAPEWFTASGTLYKAADETVNNSTVLQNDNDLLLSVGANEKWLIKMILRITSSAVADFKFLFTVPAAGAIKGYRSGEVGMLTGVNNPIAPLDLTASSVLECGAADRWCEVVGIYSGGANAGTLQLQWAQSTAEVSNTTLLATSCIITYKLG